MIVLLNGAFGVGKTTTAQLLTRRNPSFLLFDPEELGTALTGILNPVAPVDDFQEYRTWRILVAAAFGALRREFGRDLIVPMTVSELDVWRELYSAAELVDPNTIRIQLAASPQTLRSRIVNRSEAEGPHAWALAHLESGLALAANDEYGYVVDTDSLSPEEVADAVTAVIDRQPAWS
jgi:hypothetical protein